VPPIPAYGRPFDAQGRRDKAARRALRLATITPRGLVMWGAAASFVAALMLAPLVGSEFVPQTDNSFTQVNLRMPVASSIERGSAKVAQKLGEEAVECVIEAAQGHRPEIILESADVLYHLLVVWVDAGIRPEEVWAELRRREGISGIAEKAARPRAIRRVARTGKLP